MILSALLKLINVRFEREADLYNYFYYCLVRSKLKVGVMVFITFSEGFNLYNLIFDKVDSYYSQDVQDLSGNLCQV